MVSNLPICPKYRFFGNIHLSHFFLLFIPHNDAKFQKRPHNRFQDIKLRRLQSNIWVKIYPFAPNTHFLVNFIGATFSTHYLVLCCQVSKKSFEQIERYKVTQFWAKNWDRIYPFVPNKDFLAKFHSHHFFLLIICHYGAKFRKSPESRLQDMKLRSFGTKIGTKFTQLSQTRNFCKIAFMLFFSTHYLSLWR